MSLNVRYGRGVAGEREREREREREEMRLAALWIGMVGSTLGCEPGHSFFVGNDVLPTAVGVDRAQGEGRKRKKERKKKKGGLGWDERCVLIVYLWFFFFFFSKIPA